jgi:DUF1680 family protein
MGIIHSISRRKFVTSTVSAAAISSLPGHHVVASVLAQQAPRSHTATSSSETRAPEWRKEGILNLSKSPYAKLRNVPVHAVTILPGFWGQRRATNLHNSIPSMEKLLEANGRMDNFRRLAGKSSAAQRGPVYSDSDVYKWLEAAGFALQSGSQPDLLAQVDKIIADVMAAQEPGGYLGTYYVAERSSQRMLPEIQRGGHELYDIGHLLQAAVACYRATGDHRLLDVGLRFVDNFLLPNFGPRPDQKPIFSGHPEIELALIELYRTTGDKRHLDLAGYILHGDDRIKVPPRAYVYHFCGIPFTSRTRLEGHAVRAMYACCGATDYYLETGDPTYRQTLSTLWDDLVASQMYVTGGVGARADGEAFGDHYELPNARAYGESCAAIGNMMWNWRMLAATGDAKFTDVIERALYNGINSGMSLDGALYCYRNPLAFDPSSGDKIRNPWYDTTCCPPNLERTFASLPGYFYSTSNDGLYVHLYDQSQLDWRLESGTPLKVRQKTKYPWEGDVDITVTPATPAEFTLYLRIPNWTEHAQVTVNGQLVANPRPGEYLPVRRRWMPDDAVHVRFEMPPQVLEANAQVIEDTGRVAVQRGPLVYCLEQLDQPDGLRLSDVAVDMGGTDQAPGTASGQSMAAPFQEEFVADLLGGMVILRHQGAVFERSTSRAPLYFRYHSQPRKTKSVPLRFIPYYAWANRADTPMEVWIPVLRA